MKLVRALRAFDSLHSPGGEAELLFEDVRVPVSNMIKGEGCGFEIAQRVSAPAVFSTRWVLWGWPSAALTCVPAPKERVAFGEPLIKRPRFSMRSRGAGVTFEQCRLLTLQAAEWTAKASTGRDPIFP